MSVVCEDKFKGIIHLWMMCEGMKVRIRRKRVVVVLCKSEEKYEKVT